MKSNIDAVSSMEYTDILYLINMKADLYLKMLASSRSFL